MLLMEIRAQSFDNRIGKATTRRLARPWSRDCETKARLQRLVTRIVIIMALMMPVALLLTSEAEGPATSSEPPLLVDPFQWC